VSGAAASSRFATGDAFPAIEGETQRGHLNLADFRGAKHIVFWSYPMDDTPG
jgi:peroxiredoxin